MSKRYSGIVVLLVLVCMVTISGCNSGSAGRLRRFERPEKPVVYASIYPLYDFTGKIGKDRIELRQVISPGTEPHGWEPTAKLMAELEKADLFIYNGIDMELWVDDVLDAIENDRLIVLRASDGIELMPLHDDDHGHAHGHGHDTGQRKYDPHVWLDPIRAKKQGENIMKALIAADPDGEGYYRANFGEFAAQIDELDQKYSTGFLNAKRKEIVVAHAAFGYLAQRYGLEQIPIAGLSPQEEPGAAKMAEIVRMVQDKEIKYVFSEVLTNSRLAEVLASEAGIKTATLNPIGGLTSEQLEAGWDYFSVMEDNLRVLKKALEE